MIMTGNVQVSADHLTLGRDIVIPEEITHDALEPFKRLATAMHNETDNSAAAGSSRAYHCAPLAIMQLNHTGRQSTRVIGGRGLMGRPSAPSPIRVGTSKRAVGRSRPNALTKVMNNLLFCTPLQMSLDDIDNVVDKFTRGAQVAAQSGFDGVQLHAAHGCEIVCATFLCNVLKSQSDLIAQFISPKVCTIGISLGFAHTVYRAMSVRMSTLYAKTHCCCYIASSRLSAHQASSQRIS